MTASSNANTSGLEVVAYLEVSKAGMGRRACLHQRKETPTMLRRWSSEPLVTAASAQARIAELERWQAAAIRSARIHDENIREFDARATAAEARADRYYDALVQADLTIRALPGTDQSDVEFIRAALQQETQP